MLFLVVAALPAGAQQVFPDTTRYLREVTVEAQRIPVNTQASSPTQTLTASDLSRLPSLDVGEALKHLAGLQVRDYGGVGGMKTVDVRGLGSQHTGVVYDGVQVGDCQTGQVDLGRYSLGNVSFLSVTVGQDLLESLADEKGIYCNAQMDSRMLRKYARAQPAAIRMLGEAMNRLNLSARAYDRILKVSRTIADMDGSDTIQPHHIAEAIGYRSLDRASWGK